jgi:hypothetical protein
MLTTMVSA